MLSPSSETNRPAIPKLSLMQWLRAAYRSLYLIINLLLHLMLHGLWRLFGRESHWNSHFLKTTGRMLGLRVTVHGSPRLKRTIYIANHLSWLDILALGGAGHAAFVSKAEIGDVPVLGWLADINRTVYVKREHRAKVGEQIAQFKDALDHHQPVCLFPEGTTAGGTTLLPFKPTLLKVLEDTLPDLKVQPVYFDYGEIANEIAWVEEAGSYNALKLFGRKGAMHLDLYFDQPFDPAEIGHRKQISAHARARIEAMEAAALAKRGTNDYSAAL